MTDRFAIVAPPEWTASLGGDELWAVCLVDGGSALPSFHRTREEATAAADGYPVVPNSEGSTPFSAPVDLELEALAVLADSVFPAVADLADRPPPGFEVREAPTSGGLALRAGDYGLDAMVSKGLASSLGWADGTRVQLAFDMGTTRLAIFPAAGGARLEEAVAAGGLPVLELERTLPGIPGWLLEAAPSDWSTVPFEARGDHVVVELPDLLRHSAGGEATPATGPAREAPPLGRRAFIAFALVAAALGFGSLCLLLSSPPSQPGALEIGASSMPTPPGPTEELDAPAGFPVLPEVPETAEPL